MKHLFLTVVLCVFAFSANAISLQKFESLTDLWIYEEDGVTKKEGMFFVLDNNFAPISLADNPKKVGINTSDKVAAVHVYVEGFAPNSGIIKINFADGVSPKIDYPANPLGEGDEVPAYYDVLRFKYYKGNLLNKNVEFEANGQPTTDRKSVV